MKNRKCWKHAECTERTTESFSCDYFALVWGKIRFLAVTKKGFWHLLKVHSGSISVWYWISNGKCFPAGLFLQPPLCYGHFWVGKRYWVGLKNVHCKVSDEPAHPPLSRDGHTNIKFINDQSGNDFFARYNNFKNNITELFGFQKCLVQVLVLVWSVFQRFSLDARLFTFTHTSSDYIHAVIYTDRSR